MLSEKCRIKLNRDVLLQVTCAQLFEIRNNICTVANEYIDSETVCNGQTIKRKMSNRI